MFNNYLEVPEISSNSIEKIDLRILGDTSGSMRIVDMPILDGSSQFGLSRADFANNAISLIFDAIQKANQSLSSQNQARIYGYCFSTSAKAMGQLNIMTKTILYGEIPTGVTNLQAGLELVLADANEAIRLDPSRKQVIIIPTDGIPTNAQGQNDAQAPTEKILGKLFRTIYQQAKSQSSDEALTIGFIQCTSNAQTFKDYCIANSMWDESGDTGTIYKDILAATSFFNIADNRLAELFSDIPYDIVDSISADDLYQDGKLRPIADIIAKMIAD